MATFPFITQTGGPVRWTCWGGGITNHEVFTFTLTVAGGNVGALVSNVAVYLSQPGASVPSYNLTLTAVGPFANPIGATIFGQFESTGI